jgi:hypothetical protein
MHGTINIKIYLPIFNFIHVRGICVLCRKGHYSFFMNVTSCLDFPNQQFPIRTCRFNLSHSQQLHCRSTLSLLPCEVWRHCTGVNILFAKELSVHLAPVSCHLQADFPVALFVPLGGPRDEEPSHSIIPQSFCSAVVLIPTVQLCVGVAHYLTSFFD